jgi:GcrA cell cycle regulator
MGATALQQHYEADAVALPALRRAEDVVVPISRRLALTELTEKTCKWPIGDPLGEDFHFCGNDSGDSGPYCTYHARLAFQPASDRRRQK